MSLFGFGQKNQQRLSEQNGIIDVRHGASGPNVVVDGYSQTGAGLNAIWRDALSRAMPLVPAAPKVLVIGLGGGGILSVIYELFPKASITAIEHDPEMVAITRELKYFDPFPEPMIVPGDAYEMLAQLHERYDVIAIDIFRGGDPSPHLLTPEFWGRIKGVMAKGAVMQLNVAGSRSFLEVPARYFSYADMWRCKENYLGMFTS